MAAQTVKDNGNDVLSAFNHEIVKTKKEELISFRIFQDMLRKDPASILRDVFVVVHDMVGFFVGEGKDKYPKDQETIGYLHYDFSRLTISGADTPFFIDTMFANNFMNDFVGLLTRGDQQNRVYILIGPSGCGKSTFFNNFVKKFQEYTRMDEGRMYETVWVLRDEKDTIEVPCPSHDHPILMIPPEYRKAALNKLLKEHEFMFLLSSAKEYEWVFKRECCAVCSSVFKALLKKEKGNIEKVWGALHARPYRFDRRLSQGISIFNPNDRDPESEKEEFSPNKILQERLGNFFGDSNAVKYSHTGFAGTNNGLYVLMDIKGRNIKRFTALHNVVSEGICKTVEGVEENVRTLFVCVANPEDMKEKSIKAMKSMDDRVSFCSFTYLTELLVQRQVYESAFGSDINEFFFPGVLDIFARIVMTTRMKHESEVLNDWIGKEILAAYSAKGCCDIYGIILRQEISAGNMPEWISEEDVKKFKYKLRRRMIGELGEYAKKRQGISERESIKLFGRLWGPFSKKGKKIKMADVVKFFKSEIKATRVKKELLPSNFLVNMYDHYKASVVRQMEKSLFDYNEDHIKKDVQNYLHACTVPKVGVTTTCHYTGEKIEATKDFFHDLETRFLGAKASGAFEGFREKIAKKYVEVLHQEINVHGKKITETQLFNKLFRLYKDNLKKRVFDPFIKNENFGRALKCFGTDDFKTFDKRIKRSVELLIGNMCKRYGYDEGTAKEICSTAVDEKWISDFGNL